MTFFIMLAIVAVLALGLATFDAWAQVSRSSAEGPFDLSLVLTYGWVIGISMLGGIASFHAKVKAGSAPVTVWAFSSDAFSAETK